MHRHYQLTRRNRSGTTVKQYTDTGTHQSSVSLSVVFDSTHFADANPIPIKLSVTDSGGNKYDANVKANAYNKGYDGGGSGNSNNSQTAHGTQAASFVQGQYLSANISPTLGPSDSRTTTLNIIPTLCNFFTYAHGIENTSGSGRVWFGATDNIVDNFGHDYTIYGSLQNDPQGRTGVKEAVANKSINQPSYNFVFLDTCNSAFEADLASGFGITTLTASNDDRAFLGWQTLVEDSLKNADWANCIYQDLQNGQTINYAINDADTAYPAMKQSADPTDSHYYLSAQHGSSGDSAMTLHGTVYGGTLHQWFK